MKIKVPKKEYIDSKIINNVASNGTTSAMSIDAMKSLYGSVGGIHSFGNSYIRFTNGFQICWGNATVAAGSERAFIFEAPFISTTYTVVATGGWNVTRVTVSVKYKDSVYLTPIVSSESTATVNYVAIGTWK